MEVTKFLPLQLVDQKFFVTWFCKSSTNNNFLQNNQWSGNQPQSTCFRLLSNHDNMMTWWLSSDDMMIIIRWYNDYYQMIWRSPHCRHWSGTWCRTSSPTICLPAFLLSSHGSPSSYPLTLYQVTLAIVVVIIIIIIIIIIITIIMMMMIISISIMIKFAKLIAGRMSLLITLFLVLVNIFNNVTTNSPKVQKFTKARKKIFR